MLSSPTCDCTSVTAFATTAGGIPTNARSGFFGAVPATSAVRPRASALRLQPTSQLPLPFHKPAPTPALPAVVHAAQGPLGWWNRRPPVVPPVLVPYQDAAPSRTSTSFVTAAVRAVGPAVVRIDTERAADPLPAGLDGLFDDPALKKFFADEFGARIIPPPSRSRTERGLGSGFIVSADGIIVTNAHVVKGAEKLTVTLTDGRTFKGVVTGTDELLDLAVVKIEAGKSVPLPVAKLGESKDLHVGDWCIAVGNPHGLNNTVTLGIVSSLNRSSAEVGIPEKRLSLIQTSASLNAGNSGGPITNEFGEVIGVATAVRANAEGIGFAIPIDRVKAIVPELANGKTIAHPFVGIKMLTLTPDFARQNNSDPNAPAVIPEMDGAIVLHVIPESPAAHPLGLRRYDIIVGIDGKPCRTVNDVQAIVENAAVGQQIVVQVIRGGDKSKPIDVKIQTGDMSMMNRPTESTPFRKSTQ